MITLAQYFAFKQHTPLHETRAMYLLQRREWLRQEFRRATDRYTLDFDPDTGTEISGSRGGSGDGGFRLPTATTGRGNSAHKEATAVDDYDPGDHFDNWLTLFDYVEAGLVRNSMLELYQLYREHPDYTPGYVHLTTRRPASGNRTFIP